MSVYPRMPHSGEPRCFVIHGFNDRFSGKKNIDVVKPYVDERGFVPVDFDYGWLGLLGVRVCSASLAAKLAYEVRPGDVFIGHSHGCALAAMAINMGAPFRAGVMVHPALDPKWKMNSRTIKQIAVYYHLSDHATWAAGLLRRLSPGRLFFGKHFWGEMGSVGPKSDEHRLIGVRGSKHHGDFNPKGPWPALWAKSLWQCYHGRHGKHLPR